MAAFPTLRRALRELRAQGERARLRSVAGGLRAWELALEGDDGADAEWRRSGRFLGLYSAQGVERALRAYGLWQELPARSPLCVEISHEGVGDLLRIRDAECVFVELVAQWVDDSITPRLCIHWLLLQDPRAEFPRGRLPLPGQQHPGLGRGREVFELLVLMAARLGAHALDGVPAYLHTAAFFHRRMAFVMPEEEGQFLAILAAAERAGIDVPEASRRLRDGRCFDDEGLAHAWAPGLMRVPLKPNAAFQNAEWRRAAEAARAERFVFPR